MKEFDTFLEARQAVHDYFGYEENHRVIPMDDQRNQPWILNEVDGWVRWAENEEALLNSAGEYYQDDIYTQRFLPKYVYVGEEYTMVSCDPHVDGNKFLRIFSNSLRLPIEEVIPQITVDIATITKVFADIRYLLDTISHDDMEIGSTTYSQCMRSQRAYEFHHDDDHTGEFQKKYVKNIVQHVMLQAHIKGSVSIEDTEKWFFNVTITPETV